MESYFPYVEVYARVAYGRHDTEPTRLQARLGPNGTILFEDAPAPPWLFDPTNAEFLGEVLCDLAKVVRDQDGPTARPLKLPRLVLGGRAFIVDDRLGELRAEDDPNCRLVYRKVPQ